MWSFLLLSCENTQNRKANTSDIKSDDHSLYADLDGTIVRLSDFKGKKVLLSFWATWCKTCLKEMPSLAAAQAILEKENYVFLFPTTDSLKRVKQFQKNNTYPFRYLPEFKLQAQQVG